MAIDINYFRSKIKTALSRDFVQKIVTKFESTSFANKTTDNGSNFRTIDAISEENKTKPSIDYARAFFDKCLKRDYLVARGQYDSLRENIDLEKKRKIVAKATENIKESMDSKKGTLTLNSGVILDNPQVDSPCHILTINTDGESIISVVKAIYEIMKTREIPFDIEIPRFSDQKNGYTEAIKLNVTTADLEATIKAINSIDKVYKDKIKAPNLFNANVDNLIGYDSLLDVNGERASDKLGVVMIKAIDMTIAELGEGLTIEDKALVDYIKEAENKDEARKVCLAEIKKITSNVIDPILVNVAKIAKEEKVELNLEDVFESDIAYGELNAEFGTLEEEQEFENHNEVEFEDTEKKTDSIAKSIIKDIKAGVKAITSIDSLLTQSLIRPAINFGPIETEEKAKEEEKTDAKVTVIEPLKKEENALPGESVEKEEEIVDDNPIKKRDEFELNYLPSFLRKYSEKAQKEAEKEETQEEHGFALPGEENYTQKVVNKPSDETAAKEELRRTISNEEYIPLRKVDTKDIVIPDFLQKKTVVEMPKVVETPTTENRETIVKQKDVNEEAKLDSLLQNVDKPKYNFQEGLSEEEKLDAILNTVNTETIPVVPKPVEDKTDIIPVVKDVPKYKPYNEEEAKLDNLLKSATEEKPEEDILSAINRETADTSPSMLTTEEKIAVVADSIKKTPQTIDTVKQEKIAKYRGVSYDPQVFDFKVRNDDGEVIQKDGKDYTVLDYLEDNDVLSIIPLDSRVYLIDDPRDDSVDGRTFIRQYVIPSAVNGNNQMEDIRDRYIARIVKSDEFDAGKKKGIFGFMRK